MIKKYFIKIINKFNFIFLKQPKINKINKYITNNKNNNIISIIIDCELLTLNQYLEPVVEELQKLNDYKFEFYFGETIKGAGSSYLGYKKKNAFSTTLYQYLKGEMIFLSPHIYPKGPESALKILFDHAMCTMKFSFHPKQLYLNYDIYCVTGILYEQKIKKIFETFELIDNIYIAPVGFPKSDKLHNNIITSKLEIYSRLKLDPNKKTIIYAPSWEEGLSAREYGIELTRTILNNKNINLIVKLHPGFFISKKDKNYSFYTGNINWSENFSIFNNYNNIAFVREFKVDGLLYISDIMITDLSSVALEFFVLDKQVIFLNCPNFEKTFQNLYSKYNNTTYSELLNDPYSNAGRHVGLINYNYNTILDDIQFLIDNPDYKMKERKAYTELLLYNKGFASKMGAKTIIDNYKKKYKVKS